MTVAVLGVDALDIELVDADEHPNLILDHHRSIETFVSSSGSPSTHELWPTIITGLPPADHGITLDAGVSWGHPVLNVGSRISDGIVPRSIRSRIGSWLLNNTSTDTFRTPAAYYEQNELRTIFDDHESVSIGVPNYVVDPDTEDREHQLRRSLGDLFRRNSDAPGGHTTKDLDRFYEQCLEMVMIRIARVRRALRSQNYELVFGYTSGLDLIGHVTQDHPDVQLRAYRETDQFVGELRSDLSRKDELILVSDHGLRNGLHTDEAFVSATDRSLVERIHSVIDIFDVITETLSDGCHRTTDGSPKRTFSPSRSVEQHLDDLGYL